MADFDLFDEVFEFFDAHNDIVEEVADIVQEELDERWDARQEQWQEAMEKRRLDTHELDAAYSTAKRNVAARTGESKLDRAEVFDEFEHLYGHENLQDLVNYRDQRGLPVPDGFVVYRPFAPDAVHMVDNPDVIVIDDNDVIAVDPNDHPDVMIIDDDIIDAVAVHPDDDVIVIDDNDVMVVDDEIIDAVAVHPDDDVIVLDDNDVMVVDDEIIDAVAVHPENASAIEQSKKFNQQHRLSETDRIEYGYRDGGRRVSFDDNGRPLNTPNREIIVVKDPAHDPALKHALDEARHATQGMTTAEKANYLNHYVADLLPQNDDKVNQQILDSISPNHNSTGAEISLGQLIEAKTGVCRHRSLLFKVMADELGVPAALVRGNYYNPEGARGPHAWNEIVLEDGSRRMVDVMNNFIAPLDHPKVQHYKDVRNEPLYSEHAAKPHAKPGQDHDTPTRQNGGDHLYSSVIPGVTPETVAHVTHAVSNSHAAHIAGKVGSTLGYADIANNVRMYNETGDGMYLVGAGAGALDAVADVADKFKFLQPVAKITSKIPLLKYAGDAITVITSYGEGPERVGGAWGAVAGSSIGMVIGSIGGPPGAIVGAMVGGAIGEAVGGPVNKIISGDAQERAEGIKELMLIPNKAVRGLVDTVGGIPNLIEDGGKALADKGKEIGGVTGAVMQGTGKAIDAVGGLLSAPFDWVSEKITQYDDMQRGALGLPTNAEKAARDAARYHPQSTPPQQSEQQIVVKPHDRGEPVIAQLQEQGLITADIAAKIKTDKELMAQLTTAMKGQGAGAYAKTQSNQHQIS